MNVFAEFVLIFPLLFGSAGATHASPLLVSIHTDVFVPPGLFSSAWATKIGDQVVCKAWRGGVVNHHALASDQIAGFFATLRRCRSKVTHFIILSPDHFSRGHGSLATHDRSYHTRGITIESEAASVPMAIAQPELFEHEHGIGALIPFLAHAFPDARVIPLAVKSSIGEGERAQLAGWLEAELEKPGRFVLVSSDMSHYLGKQRAESNDQLTKRAFETGDAYFFANANDGFTDNGDSIAATIRAFGKSKWTLLRASISSAYGGSPGFTTSYLVGFWE